MQRNKLTAIAIKNAVSGKLQDGAGLYLIKSGATGRWIFRYQLLKRRREMGLGSFPTVSLADARKARDRAAAQIAAGTDPVDEKRRREALEKATRDRIDPTLTELTMMVFEAKKAGLKRDGIAGRWLSPLDIHVLPKLGHRRVSTLQADDFQSAIHSIWRTKHLTAEKAVQRLRIVLRNGKRMGMPCDPESIDIAQYMMGEVLHVGQPIAATSWQDIPKLFEDLNGKGTPGACLQFMILTAVRSAGCRGAQFSEIDGDTWTVPADRMKGKVGKVRDFAVPLSSPAQELITTMSRISETFVFPGRDQSKGISDTALAKTLNTLKELGRPHGFRTSFRTWVQDTEAASYDVTETALAHTVGNKVERSYARSDLLEPRRILAEKWGRFVTQSDAVVVDLSGRAV